ncbi:hypothetical protein FA95DRAFT_71409 [Auriscalpium vulgare]|uniref:Uncharacterized protein n=1 Tax=Auriscalpium vulgare TaxID=40419 RepID=A0ACB8S8E2_9AGAM|nr:hypothetical protein FA95DRAFT_71409 [Auriscalpium vulgare]
MTADAEQVDKKPDLDKISVQVSFQGRVIKFRLKRANPLRKVMEAAAKQLNMEKGTLRFTYDGRRLQPEDDDTPESLGMEEEDEIEAHIEQEGGQSPFTVRLAMQS